MKRSNWLYKIYNLSRYNKEYTDICEFIGTILTNICIAVVVISIAILIIVPSCLFIIDIILNIFSVGSFMLYFGSLSGIGFTILLITFLFFLVFLFAESFELMTNTLVYKSWKEKTCYLIKFED